MVSALDKKLLRDAWRMRGPMLSIAVVLAVGIAVFVSLRGNYVSLQLARHAYYQRQHFGDVFASLARAPESAVAELESIDGVARVDARVVEAAMIPLATTPEPVRARIVSLPRPGATQLNAVHLRGGRMVATDKSDEALVLEAFAEAHGLELGDELPVVINGRLRAVRIVGTAMSPEYVMAVTPGDMAPSPKKLAILWMDPTVVAAAYRMEGAFNDVSLELQPGASSNAVLAEVDRALERYGGTGAVPRAKQASNYTIEGELTQLQSTSSRELSTSKSTTRSLSRCATASAVRTARWSPVSWTRHSASRDTCAWTPSASGLAREALRRWASCASILA